MPWPKGSLVDYEDESYEYFRGVRNEQRKMIYELRARRRLEAAGLFARYVARLKGVDSYEWDRFLASWLEVIPWRDKRGLGARWVAGRLELLGWRVSKAIGQAQMREVIGADGKPKSIQARDKNGSVIRDKPKRMIVRPDTI